MRNLWSTEIKERRKRGRSLEFTLENFADQTHTKLPNEELTDFLNSEVANGTLESVVAYICPFNACVLTADQAESDQCPTCKRDFLEEARAVTKETRFKIMGQLSRDVRWIIIIHGMNSRAAWQEDFTWMVANKFRYSVPVLVYKYGWITIDVLVKWRHHCLARALGKRIRMAIAYARERGLERAPDVIAHSFGSRLFTILLADPKFEDLQFGRVITAGSIVVPNFDWFKYISTSRIEAVLNHAAGKDLAVPFAQFLIPGSGPGGRIGYMDSAAKNVKTAEFGHSSCLTEEALGKALIEEGVWDRFLRHPLEEFTAEEQFSVKPWKPANFLLRAAGRILGILVFTALAPVSLVRRLVDR